jgi:hypothetical protein
MRVLAIICLLAVFSVALLFAHVIVTPAAALVVALVLGSVAGVTDVLLRHR